ncbi:protein PhnA [Peribacillus frigoritolerans]|nr:protein PhnA [Peribacillus frigoritolerans]
MCVNHYYIKIGIMNGGSEFMPDFPNCPACDSEYTYEDGSLLVCPECAHEWTVEAETENGDQKKVIKDANGNALNDGDTVTVIKDLKVKGSSSVLKMGTKVKSIRLVDGDHDIDCKIDGFGAMKLKSQFVKKV